VAPLEEAAASGAPTIATMSAISDATNSRFKPFPLQGMAGPVSTDLPTLPHLYQPHVF
jgi:hypothetical protein